MKLTRKPQENHFGTPTEEPQVADSISGIIEQFQALITMMEQDPYFELKLENDSRIFTGYSFGHIDITLGTPVTLHALDGFEAAHDEGSNFYLDGIELTTTEGKVLLSLRNSSETQFAE
ncbi:MAG: hypothetical protein ACI9QC_000280 [Oceanicoccus sp.]|jgi:hypothetical protein